MPLASTNPATGETVHTVAPLSPAALEEKLARAREAFARQRALSFAERAAPLQRLAALLEGEADRLARLMALEMGKPLQAGRDEAAKCATAFRYYAAHAARLLAEEPVEVPGGGRAAVRYEPLGPLLALMPWNFPFWQVARAAAPALMAGNVVLLKHADNVPQCAAALEELFLRSGCAPGVFQNLDIEIQTLPQLIEDPRVAAVTLTGSVAAGRSVAAKAGAALKPTVLELGGSDPFLVLPSAPLEETAAQAVKARMLNGGQSCIAAKRFLVHEAVYADFERLFVEKCRTLKVGDPLDPATEIGPLAHAKALASLERQVAEAMKAGARILCGGRRLPGPGFYFEPTALAGLPPDAPVAKEEWFGPAALLFPARDLDEMLRLANGTPFGLGASVWTNDPAEQERAIADLEAGQVFVNGLVASQPALPFGGVKDSGYGRELGAWGLRSFVNVKTVRVA